MNEVNPDVERLPALKSHATALEAFINSPAHEGFKEACDRELEITNANLLCFEPNNLNDLFELFKLYGERRERAVQSSRFEVAYDGLKKRIADAELSIQKS